MFGACKNVRVVPGVFREKVYGGVGKQNKNDISILGFGLIYLQLKGSNVVRD